MIIGKPEFIDKMSKKGYTKQDCEMIYNDFIEVIKESLIEGDTVSFRGFGVFSVKEHKERNSVNMNREKIVIPAYKSVSFKPGVLFKKEIKVGRKLS